MECVSLWSVTVNNECWDSPRTDYFTTRKSAECHARYFPNNSGIRYIGRFNMLNAMYKMGTLNKEEYNDIKAHMRYYGWSFEKSLQRIEHLRFERVYG